ncbi:putative gustatory receptor 28a [Cotesia typhae]|uniref:putative gustatory receptor 28a n=1 Tax=Cotesia typhae TaxID=2053667 RepID=UPI003D690068
MIDERFKLINSNIIKLCNKEVELIITKPSFIALPPHLHRSVLVDVISIRQAYNKLCNICNKTADFYGVPLLFTLIYNSILFMNALYIGIIAHIGMNEPLLIEEIIQGVIVVWFVTQFVILTSYVSKIINQSEETPIIINALMSRCTFDVKIERELLNFLHELSFRKVKFTSCDIISIDRSFLATITDKVVIYLIILIQFRIGITKK